MSLYRHFSESEITCKCGCGMVMDDDFMRKIESMRESAGFPFTVSSAARCKAHDESVGGAGPHQTGRAMDIKVFGEQAHQLIKLALAHGMTGIGVKQHGPHEGRFIHIDDLDYETRPWIWSYA